MANATAEQTKNCFRLSVSDMGFGQDCPRCLYLSAVNGIKETGGMFSSTLRTMEKEERTRFESLASLQTLCPDAPDGRVEKSKGRPTSAPLWVEGAEITLTGQYDYLVALADGGYAVVKFCTSRPKDNNLPKIARQLNAMALLLANNSKPAEVKDVKQIGIIIFDPNAFDAGKVQEMYSYIPLDLDVKGLRETLATTVKMLQGDMPAYTREKGEISCPTCERDSKLLALMGAE